MEKAQNTANQGAEQTSEAGKAFQEIANGVLSISTLNHQITNPEILKSIIRPMHNNRDAQHILQSYLRKRKVIKIINLDVNHQSL